MQDIQNGVFSTYDPASFGFATDGGAVIPSNFAPAVDPLDDLFASYGFMGSSTDFGAAVDHDFTSAGSSNLPMLPPPPPSPPSMFPGVGQLSEPGPSAPRSRRRQEVDIGNILHTACPRAPSKRFAEYEASEDVSGPPQKKSKSKKIACRPNIKIMRCRSHKVFCYSRMIGDAFLEHPFFSLENTEPWINLVPFQAFMIASYGIFGQQPSSRAPSRAASRSSSRMSFQLSSRASSPAPSDFSSRPPSSLSMADITSNFSSRPPSSLSMADIIVNNDSDSAPAPPPTPLALPHVSNHEPSPSVPAAPITKPKRKAKGKSDPGQIKITRELKVDARETLDKIPATWVVPRVPTDQESWTGSNGHRAGDVKVFGLTDDPDESILCRRCPTARSEAAAAALTKTATKATTKPQAKKKLQKSSSPGNLFYAEFLKTHDAVTPKEFEKIWEELPAETRTTWKTRSKAINAAKKASKSQAAAAASEISQTWLMRWADLTITRAAYLDRAGIGSGGQHSVAYERGGAVGRGQRCNTAARQQHGSGRAGGQRAAGSRQRAGGAQAGRRAAGSGQQAGGQRAAGSGQAGSGQRAGGLEMVRELREPDRALRQFASQICPAKSGHIWLVLVRSGLRAFSLGVKCDGVPILVRLKNASSYGKKFFIGCSKWSRNQRFDHIYWNIPSNVDENDLRFVMENNGRLLTHMTENETSYTHVVDGRIIPAKITNRPCKTEMLIFIPVKQEHSHKAYVLLRNPHNHPTFNFNFTQTQYQLFLEKITVFVLICSGHVCTTFLAREKSWIQRWLREQNARDISTATNILLRNFGKSDALQDIYRPLLK
ncbi:hypothetical protein B0H12DRAFT_1306538 [Mycena haematopus]|nr:hypothetical protein B0H12DRAFT_1306538 [Mycena haematopus]